MRPGRGAYAALLLCGAGWGLTQPLIKIAIGAGWQPLAILFWQTVVVVVLLAPLSLRGARPARLGAALGWAAAMGLLGTLLPNFASYTALAALPSSVVSILLSTIPLLALPMALAAGLERPDAARLGGLALGLAGVALLIAPGGAGGVPAYLLPLGLVAPLFYAGQNVLLGRYGRLGLTPVQFMAAGSAVALPFALGAALAVDAFRWPAPDAASAAVLAASAIHAAAFCTLVALIARTGPVFSTQVGYLVTLFGVGWAALLLGERPGPAAFGAIAAIFAGVALVRPRRPAPSPPNRAPLNRAAPGAMNVRSADGGRG